MTIHPHKPTDESSAHSAASEVNPALESAKWAYDETDLVKIDDKGVKSAARYIYDRLLSESYTPRTWRTHPLHICPPEPYSPSDPQTGAVMNWVFFISSLNFSFWSEKEGREDRYGVQWRQGWAADLGDTEEVHMGYWSLVAAIDRALEEGIPLTDPTFYASETKCPADLLWHVFRPAQQCSEPIPLFKERVKVLREVGSILTTQYGGSFQTFFVEFQRMHDGHGTALQLVKFVTQTFPSFRDETYYNGRRVCIWKRAQILVAELWAAFYPPSPTQPHPLFPSPPSSSSSSPSPPSLSSANLNLGTNNQGIITPQGGEEVNGGGEESAAAAGGAQIQQLTMFADYRVPQILHHLGILTYPPSLLKLLRTHATLESGCREELSIRSASIVAVERVRLEMLKLAKATAAGGDSGSESEGESEGEGESESEVGGTKMEEDGISSVLIDFYLWDLAKDVEVGKESIKGIETVPIEPAHRTRSIWY